MKSVRAVFSRSDSHTILLIELFLSRKRQIKKTVKLGEVDEEHSDSVNRRECRKKNRKKETKHNYVRRQQERKNV